MSTSKTNSNRRDRENRCNSDQKLPVEIRKKKRGNKKEFLYDRSR